MSTEAAPPPPDENQVVAERRAKLAALRAAGRAYPNDFRRNALAGALHAEHDAQSHGSASRSRGA